MSWWVPYAFRSGGDPSVIADPPDDELIFDGRIVTPIIKRARMTTSVITDAAFTLKVIKRARVTNEY